MQTYDEDSDMRRRGHKKKRIEYIQTSKTTLISVRIKNEFIPKLEASENKAKVVNDALEHHFNSSSNSQINTAMDDLEQTEYNLMKSDVIALKNGIVSLFELYKANSENFILTEAQRNELKNIFRKANSINW